jgi:hypothetical protein
MNEFSGQGGANALLASAKLNCNVFKKSPYESSLATIRKSQCCRRDASRDAAAVLSIRHIDGAVGVR